MTRSSSSLLARAGLVVAALGALIAPAAAQPHRHRRVAQAPGETSPDDAPQAAAANDDDGDGPEARAALPVKIDDLISNAVRLSPDLAKARDDRAAAHDAAAASRRDQAWILSTSASYQRSNQADHVDVPLFSMVSDSKLNALLGIGRNLPSGGNVQLQLEAVRDEQEVNIPRSIQSVLSGQAESTTNPTQTNPTAPSTDVVQANSTALTLTYKQPILRGFGPATALAPERKADLQASEATIKAQLAAEELVRDIITGYWELAYASYEVDVRQQSLDLAKRQDQLTHEQMRAGVVASNDAASVEYELATREEALLRAKLTLEQKSLELRQKAGLELGRRAIVLRPEEPFQIDEDDQDFDIDDVLQRAHVANRQLATVLLEKKIADVDYAVADDQTRPELDLSVSGAIIGMGPDAGQSLTSLGNGDSFQVSVGLSASFELSGAARAGRDAAREARHKVDVDRADLERQIDTQVVTAVHAVAAARMRVALSDKAIAVAEQTARAARANFLVGRTSDFEVMQRQTQLIEARLAKGRAVADYREAVAEVRFLSGTLLSTYGVAVRSHAEEE